MARTPISFLAPVYNEASRIRNVIEHALCWADEIIIADKGSTDGTLDICRSYGDRVRVTPIPFTERGHEKMTDMPALASNDWIFYGTCSEIPTRQLIESCRAILDRDGGQIDLVYVPRRMYFFGLHFTADNWGVCHYPFLIHRTRTVVTNTIHDNFHAADPARTRRVPYSEDCCVHHLTHPTVGSFWKSSAQYFEVEARETKNPEKEIRQCLKNIDKLSQRVLVEGENWLPFYCSLASYELGKALYVWESSREAKTAAPYYSQLAQHLLHKEWNVPVEKASEPVEIADPIKQSGMLAGVKPILSATSRFPYMLIKITLGLKRLFGGK